MRLQRLKIAIPCGLAVGLGLAACSTSREQVEQPPNARSLIMVHKAILWRDLESIKNASITAPERHAGGWRVCVRLDTKGALGTNTGERAYPVPLYGAHRRPDLPLADAPGGRAPSPGGGLWPGGTALIRLGCGAVRPDAPSSRVTVKRCGRVRLFGARFFALIPSPSSSYARRGRGRRSRARV